MMENTYPQLLTRCTKAVSFFRDRPKKVSKIRKNIYAKFGWMLNLKRHKGVHAMKSLQEHLTERTGNMNTKLLQIFDANKHEI